MHTNTTERKALNSQKKAIKLLNLYSLDVRAWEILVAVAQAPGEGLLDLLPKLEMSKSAFSRYTQLMSGEVIEAKTKRDKIEAGRVGPLGTLSSSSNSRKNPKTTKTDPWLQL